MIKEFVDCFMNNKEVLKERLEKIAPGDYREIVHEVIKLLHDHSDDYSRPDPSRIHEIDDGHYQGTLVYVIAASYYQPSDYWYVKMEYGSCSVCDTLQSVNESLYIGKESDEDKEKRIKGYMTIALHIVQNLKSMD